MPSGGNTDKIFSRFFARGGRRSSAYCQWLTLKNRTFGQRRRSASLRYQKPRFDNRAKQEGWLAPSV
ncbi:MAG: RRXRR domain-containing protein [Deltaproteobacteria bacterium]|nr:RRXRR domain-containing protein [Deltaproteobacteria bacterium]